MESLFANLTLAGYDSRRVVPFVAPASTQPVPRLSRPGDPSYKVHKELKEKDRECNIIIYLIPEVRERKSTRDEYIDLEKDSVLRRLDNEVGISLTRDNIVSVQRLGIKTSNQQPRPLRVIFENRRTKDRVLEAVELKGVRKITADWTENQRKEYKTRKDDKSDKGGAGTSGGYDARRQEQAKREREAREMERLRQQQQAQQVQQQQQQAAFFPQNFLIGSLPTLPLPNMNPHLRPMTFAQPPQRPPTAQPMPAPPPPMATGRPGVDPTHVDITCNICLDEKKTIVFVPCGHMVSCESCWNNVRRSTMGSLLCPLCRSDITSTVRTYL